MGTEFINAEHAGNTGGGEAELRRRYDDLQRRVTRFSVVEQELINTRNQLDRELERFTRIHKFNTQAIKARTDAAFAASVAEAIVDVFEVEFGGLWLADNEQVAAALAGLGADPAAEGKLGAWLCAHGRNTRANHALLLNAGDFTDLPPVPLRQVIITVCRDAGSQPLAFLAGGITATGADFHDAITAGHMGAFVMFAQQVSALWENRRHQATIEHQIRQIELSEERLTLALEGSNTGLWDWEIQRDVVFFSKEWCAQIGYAPGELANSAEEWRSRVHPDDLAATLADLQAHLERRTPHYENIHRLRHRDGHYVWTLTRGRALRDAQGQAYRMVGTHLDITAQKELERRLREAEEAQRLAREQAEAANHAKSIFLATMSHEIRTPLNGVLGAMQLLRDSRLTQEQAHLADTAEHSANVLLAIIGDILDLSKIESGRLELEMTSFHLPNLVRETVASFATRAQEKLLKLDLRLGAHLPTGVRGDPTRLRQVLNNLIGNAIKFTARGAVLVTVNLLSREAEISWLELSVRDTGIGIGPEAQARIFEPFAQADSSTTRRFGGTGLGLAISRRLIEIMGGEIRLVSEEGAGADFRVRIPLVDAELLSAVPPVAPSAAGPSDPSSFSGRVLVVEDNPIGQKIAPAMLRRLGLEVDVVGDGKQSLEALRQQRYDAVFMDCHMPVMDGYEATQTIRKLEANPQSGFPPHTWIIALTANALAGERERCLGVGMDDFLTKPLDGTQLTVALKRAFAAGAAAAAERLAAPEATPTPKPDPAPELLPPASPPTPPGPAAIPPEVFNPQALVELCDQLDTESVCEILRDFLADLPGRPAEMEGQWNDRRFPELERAAHSLKGLGVQFGLLALGKCASTVEDAAEAREETNLPALLGALKTEAERATQILADWLAAHAGGEPPPSG